MNQYDAYLFLLSVRDAKIEQTRCEARLEELRRTAQRTVATYGDEPRGGGGDVHHDDVLVAIADQAEELLRLSAAYLKRVKLVESFIADIPDARYRTILRLRYVDGKKWEDVTQSMHEYDMYYDMRHVARLHADALEEARAYYPAFVRRHPEIQKEDSL